MTHTEKNKSKILALILGLMMCLALMLGIVMTNPVDTARAEETDTRIMVSAITATSDVDSAEYNVVKPTTVAINDEIVPVTDLVGKVYNETAQEPTFGGTLVRGTDYEVSYAGKAGSTDGLDFSGKPVDAGTYIVTVTGKGAYSGSFTKEFVINKAEQTNVPVGLIANPISCREGSGTIGGVTIAMEYRKVGDADYTKCTSSKITGLAAGEYQIRYAENDNYLAGADVTVTVAISHNLGTLNEETPATCIDDGMKAHYYCSDCGKFFDESKFYAHGESVTVTAEDKEGKVFKGWEDESGEIVSTKKEYTFNVMEEKNLTAVYDDMPSGGGEITPPAQKDGLSGGQIAGIVIGTVLLAGIGGFAIFWFAVKKKTFADLITVIKALFTKKK